MARVLKGSAHPAYIR